MKAGLVWMLCFVQLTVMGQECLVQIAGQVLDFETKEPIPFVTVQSSEVGKGAVTDLDGKFVIQNLCNSETELMVTHVGYKPSVHHHDVYHNSPIIYLAPDNQLLESVVVEGEYNPVALESLEIDRLDHQQIEKFQSSNIGELVSNIGGVSVISTGQNIMKPIIHGLHGNRILVINNEVRHEFQNWGVEHAPEIDASSAQSVQVVKGAAAVRYGADALGGVLLINQSIPELSAHFHGEAGLNAASNGRAIGGNLTLTKGWEHIALSIHGDYVRQGDLQTPKYQLSNTGKEELGFSATARYHRKRFDLETYYSHFGQELGILRGSVSGSLVDFQEAIAREIPSNTTDFSYDINNPRQVVSHDLFKLKGIWVFDHQDLEVQYAYQYNKRSEYDVRRSSLNSFPITHLGLGSHNLDIVWNMELSDQWNTTSGLHVGYRDNNILPGTKTVPFLPNYDDLTIGLFEIGQLRLEAMTLEFGLRLDQQNTVIRGIDQYENRYDGSLNYTRMSGSFGIVPDMQKSFRWSSNVGMGWRSPNIWELYSFGKHGVNIEYGLWRYQIDNEGITADEVLTSKEKPVKAETGYKWINTIQGEVGVDSWKLSSFVNYLDGYIYGKPAGVTSTVNGVYPYYVYDQTNALFFGLDATYRKQFMESLEGEFQGSYLYATDLSEHDSFVEIPPMNIKSRFTYQLDNSAVGDPEFFISGNYTFKYWQQPQVIYPNQFQLTTTDVVQGNFDFMDASEGYFLMDIGVSGAFRNLKYVLRINNLWNQTYRVNTDRLRYFSDQLGRNLKLTVTYQFH